MLFRSWEGILRVVIASAIIYVFIVGALRVIGARALAKMSAYDLIVSIALGSLVAAIPLSTDISVLDGIAAIVTFLALQELTRLAQARFRVAHHIVRERPHLVLWDGKLIDDRMKALAASPDEVRAAIRQAGLLSLDDVQAVVLENDGTWSVLRRYEVGDLSSLEGLDIPGHGPVENGDGPRPRSGHAASRDNRPSSSTAGQI
ncbi:MAG TPA: YetF domain-containing protein [Gemmatimonadaceae bacterium]|nr:YetF domain-containing protein [Gemmatimonadaceae bacterium]